GKQYLVALHGYSNKTLFLPGIEAELPPIEIGKKSKSKYWTLHSSAMLWVQPQSFYSEQGRPGGLLRLRSAYSFNSTWKIYATLESKTEGWVAGHPFLKPNFGIRGGVSAQFSKTVRN